MRITIWEMQKRLPHLDDLTLQRMFIECIENKQAFFDHVGEAAGQEFISALKKEMDRRDTQDASGDNVVRLNRKTRRKEDAQIRKAARDSESRRVRRKKILLGKKVPQQEKE